MSEAARPCPRRYAVDLRQRVRLGGRPQQIQVLAARHGLPSLVVLHGGPGMAGGRAFLDRHQALAEHVTLVTWDQRGAGASFVGAGREPLTLDGLVSDAAELVRYVHAHNPGAPLYLLGLSWGSELGIRLVQRHPEGVAGFVGSGQAVDGVRGEELSYAWVLGRAEAAAADRSSGRSARRRARRHVAALRRIGPPRDAQYRPMLLGLAVQRAILDVYVEPQDAVGPVPDGAGPAARPAPDSTGPGPAGPARVRRRWPVPLSERIGGPLGLLRSLTELWPTATRYDFRAEAAHLEVPVWFLQGRHDHTTPSALVEEYAAVLTAPRVELVWFDHSGHSPARDEPALFRRRLVDALTT